MADTVQQPLRKAFPLSNEWSGSGSECVELVVKWPLVILLCVWECATSGIGVATDVAAPSILLNVREENHQFWFTPDAQERPEWWWKWRARIHKQRGKKKDYFAPNMALRWSTDADLESYATDLTEHITADIFVTCEPTHPLPNGGLTQPIFSDTTILFSLRNWLRATISSFILYID